MDHLDLTSLEDQLDELDRLMERAGAPMRLRDRIQDVHASIEWTRLYLKGNRA